MKATHFLTAGLVALATAFTGCDKPVDSGTKSAATTKTTPKEEDHEHGPGPHQGTVFDFGKYHAEFVVDHPKKQVTVYILDGSMKKAVAMKAEKLLLSIDKPKFQVDLLPVPQDGDAKGSSSRFVATNDKFGVEQPFAGSVSGEVEGKPYVGDFDEKPAKK